MIDDVTSTYRGGSTKQMGTLEYPLTLDYYVIQVCAVLHCIAKHTKDLAEVGPLINNYYHFVMQQQFQMKLG